MLRPPTARHRASSFSLGDIDDMLCQNLLHDQNPSQMTGNHFQQADVCMTRTEAEHSASQLRLEEGERQMKSQQSELEKLDLSKAEIRRGMAPVLTFHGQSREDVQRYERLRRGDKKELANLQELGQILIGLRLSAG